MAMSMTAMIVGEADILHVNQLSVAAGHDRQEPDRETRHYPFLAVDMGQRLLLQLACRLALDNAAAGG